MQMKTERLAGIPASRSVFIKIIIYFFHAADYFFISEKIFSELKNKIKSYPQICVKIIVIMFLLLDNYIQKMH
jgi:hypothetical protein